MSDIQLQALQNVHLSFANNGAAVGGCFGTSAGGQSRLLGSIGVEDMFLSTGATPQKPVAVQVFDTQAKSNVGSHLANLNTPDW